MLGSHNSMSYGIPQWFFGNIWGRCQNKNIQTQYTEGVRFFDIRLKYKKNGKLTFCHGIINYKNNIDEVLEFLNSKGAYIRFFLEKNKKHKEKFATYIISILKKYPNLKHTGTYYKKDESVIVDGDYYPIIHKYSSVLGWKRYFWIPYFYAKKYNKNFKTEYSSILKSRSSILLLDFI